LKKLDRLILHSFIGPFVATFFVALFVLVMQFLWLYIDDLVGKGLEIQIIAKLIFYASASLVSMALPIAVLLSSIMTFGNLGEHYELIALKSSGISLLRIMASLIVVTFILAAIAFCFSNYLLPKANLKSRVLLYDISHKRPAFDVMEKTFYNGIDGYSLKVDKKSADGKTLNDVIIYDYTKGRGNNNVTIAEKAILHPDPEGKYLTFQLINGEQYEEQQAKPKPGKDDNFEHLRTRFKEYYKVFDMSGFEMKNTNEELFKKNYQMLNIRQLQYSVDSIDRQLDNHSNILHKQLKKYIALEKDTLPNLKDSSLISQSDSLQPHFLDPHPDSTVLALIPLPYKNKVIKKALDIAKNAKGYINVVRKDIEIKERKRNKYQMEWHRKLVLSFGCILLFFIGAPLGAITRKGGLGLPIILSIVFFVLYHLLNTFGKKLGEEFVLSPFYGMWLSTILLSPVGMFLTWKALNDSNFFNINVYANWLRKRFQQLGWIKEKSSI